MKFWDFEVANGNLGMVHTRSLKVTDDVLCVRYSRHKQQSKLLLAGVGLFCYERAIPLRFSVSQQPVLFLLLLLLPIIVDFLLSGMTLG